MKKKVVTNCVRVLLSAFTMVMAITAVISATPTFEPVFRPELFTNKSVQSIRIDGKIDESEWRSAGKIGNFVERSPGDNLPPQVQTEAFITYDEDHLYVGFLCKDDPSQVRATMCQRDQYSGDDAVILLLDTFGEAAWAYEFQVNPYGIQKDLLWTNVQGEDSGFDLIWESAAQIHDSGYTVEMAIPFASMRFPNRDVQSWRMDLWRIHPRESYRQYSWSANDRDEQCWPCQWGTVTGIEGVHPGRGLEILPSVISSQAGSITDPTVARPDFDNKDIDGQFSIGGKYSLSSDITVEATANPDFSQIEADAAQFDVNTTVAIFYPERRPFFQEGADLFRTLFNSFYTRMVNDPDLAAKGTARWDKTSLAYMVARDANSPYSIPLDESGYTINVNKSTVNVLRGLHQIGNNSQVGFLLGDRRFDEGGYGSILAADGRFRLSRNYIIDGQWIWSLTEEPTFSDPEQFIPDADFAEGKHTAALDGETYGGGAFITRFRRQARNFSFFIDYNQVDGDYRTQLGYDPWNNYRNLSGWMGYTFRPEEGLFSSISPQLYADRRWNYDGQRKWTHYNAQMGANLRWAQTFVGTGINLGTESWGGTEFENLYNLYVDLGSRPWDFLGYNLHYSYGPGVALFEVAKGNERNIRFSFDIKPIDRLIIEPTVNYIKSTHVDDGHLLFRQMIARTRTRFQVNPRLSVRLVVQYNEADAPPYLGWNRYHVVFGKRWDIDPLITYRINSFSMFYLGSTHDYKDFSVTFPNEDPGYQMTSRQFFMKIQYLFQI